MNNKILKKLILVVVLTLTVAATWLYANPRDIATDSGFDASYDSGGGCLYPYPQRYCTL